MKDAVPGTHFQFSLNNRAPIFLLLGVNVGTLKVGGGFSLPNAFSRAFISVAVDMAGIRVGSGAVGAGGWFFRRVVIRSVFFWHGHEMLMIILLVVSVLLLVVMHLFFHGFHEGVQANDMLDRLLIWFWGWNRRSRWRQRS